MVNTATTLWPCVRNSLYTFVVCCGVVRVCGRAVRVYGRVVRVCGRMVRVVVCVCVW